jgi:two-component system, chemotaxis family, CheB/CheR fusion protein
MVAVLVESARKQESPKAARGLRIVVAEDDRDSMLMLAMILRDAGHEVRCAYDGGEALDAIRGFDPDVVLLDIALPTLSGWEVARRIRERCGHTRPLVVGVSGEYRLGADKVLSDIIGFDYYLLKPYDPQLLIKLIAPLPDR